MTLCPLVSLFHVMQYYAALKQGTGFLQQMLRSNFGFVKILFYKIL